jgi:hypothetical protein
VATTDRPFRADLKAELERLFRPPRTEVTSVATNALLVAAAWTLLPDGARDWLFRLNGPMAFAVVLLAWMLGDAATTNVLGNDVAGALATLPDPKRLERALRVKSAALALLVAVPCVVVAAALAIAQHAYVAGLLLCVVVAVAPFGAAAVGQWVGILWPYHRRELRWRWEQRGDRRRTSRWIALIIAPFLVVPAVMAAFLAAGLAVGIATGGRTADGHLDNTGMALAALLAIALSVTAFAIAPRVSTSLARRRQAALTATLTDPDRG